MFPLKNLLFINTNSNLISQLELKLILKLKEKDLGLLLCGLTKLKLSFAVIPDVALQTAFKLLTPVGSDTASPP
jgi:hypothetical protein